jgi:adenosylcobinamide-phosphate guanylyltransferase
MVVVLALLMCGGRGNRMKLPFRGVNEKPLLKVCGKTLVEYSLSEVKRAGISVVALTSEYTPNTEKFLKSRGIRVIRAPGTGYIQDILWFVRRVRLTFPFMVISADLVFFRNVIEDVIDYYIQSNSTALSCVDREGKNIGINILDGYYSLLYPNLIQPQVEMVLEGVANVNTRDDVKAVEEKLRY